MRSYCLLNCARVPDEGAFPRPPAGGIIMSMGFSADGLLLAAGDNKGAAHVWAKQPSGYVGPRTRPRCLSLAGPALLPSPILLLAFRASLSPAPILLPTASQTLGDCAMQIVELSDVAKRT